MSRRWPTAGRAAALAAAVAVTALARPAAAKPNTGPVVAVLPLAADDPVALYSVPVAGAVVNRLRRAKRYRVELVSLGDAIPARVDLVVDGSLRSVGERKQRVVLSLRVRDPEHGTAQPVVASAPVPVSEIDGLAEALGDALVGALDQAARHQRKRRAAAERKGPIVLPEAVIQGVGARARKPAVAAQVTGPPMVVFTATGSKVGLDTPVDLPATRVAYAVAYQLGFRPIAHAATGIVAPDTVREALAAAGARWGLMLDVRNVDIDWLDVYVARCQFRLVLVDANARAHLDVVRRTDTVVGNRGDRQPALVRYVMTQVGDIAYAALKRALPK